MRFPAGVVLIIAVLAAALLAQSAGQVVPPSVTVPFAQDQGRIVIDVDLSLPDGKTERVRGWVDNGNPDLYMNRRVANLMGITLSCDGQVCTGALPSQNSALDIAIGAMKIPLSAIKKIKVPAVTSALAPGMSAEINIPSSVLRNYDVLINFPDRELTIGLPGHLKFKGVSSKMFFDADGLIRIPGKIENKNYDLGLDLGSSVNFLSAELFDKISSAHPDWPHMVGAVGPFNLGEFDTEPKWRLMRLDRMQFGPLFLTDVAATDFSTDKNQRPGIATAGVVSSEALTNYHVGLDYAHSTVYFEIGRTVKFPDFDVVGLILRPEGDSDFAIIGIADFDGNPSVQDGQDGVQVGDHLVAVNDIAVADSTLGQVWSQLEGIPGQERKLTIARAGKQFTVVAKVQHFLGEMPQNAEQRYKGKK